MPCCALICREAMLKRHLVNAVEALSWPKSQEKQKRQARTPSRSIAVLVVVFKGELSRSRVCIVEANCFPNHGYTLE